MRRKIVITPRKEPRQARSRQMREDILEAAVRVLRRDGVLQFTTPRVAEAAGISIGSLYQYFPNKQALIFAIHSRITERAWVQVQAILDHPKWSPRQKLGKIARIFFLAESADVVEMGLVLDEVAIYFEDQPELRALDEQVLHRFMLFVREALPAASDAKIQLSARLIITVLESVGKAVARRRLSVGAVSWWARECVDMLADRVGLP